MSHVPEGELTAYADGAYATGDPDASRIEAHLALCENCRNRLEQAHALSARATEILAVATPVVNMPPFDEVRARAVGRRQRPAVPLTWAATVILALGIGWFGRGYLNDPRAQRSFTRAEPISPAVAEQEESALPEPAPMPAVPPPATGGAPTPLADAAREQLQRRAGTETRTETRPDPQALAAVPAEAPPSAPAITEFAGKGVEGGHRAARADIEYMTAGDAERRGIELHAVPELEIVRVGVRDRTVVVEQKLADGRIVMVTSTPETVAIEQKAEAEMDRDAPGRTRDAAARQSKSEAAAAAMVSDSVVAVRSGVRITVSGVLPADSLRALANRVR